MNIKTTKQLSLLCLFSLMTACSTQNTSGPGSQVSLGGQQSASSSQSSTGSQSSPGGQLFNRQNRSGICIDKTTGKAIPGCKAPTKLASAGETKKLPSATVPATSKKMRKIVLKAPKTTIPAKVMAKPKPVVMTKPRTPVRATTSAPQIRPNSNLGRLTSKPAVINRPRAAVRPAPVVRPTPRVATPAPRTVPRTAPVRRPVVTQPYNAGIIANPVRSAPAVRPPARPVVKPVVKPVVRKPAPARKPQTTMRRLTLSGSANFRSGSSRLTGTGQTKLLALSLSLQEGQTQINRLLIEGHTDSVGNASMNQALSLRRANAVAEYLAKKGGFARSMMQTVGLGESKPIGDNKTRKGRAQNRRVEITATGMRRITR